MPQPSPRTAGGAKDTVCTRREAPRIGEAQWFGLLPRKQGSWNPAHIPKLVTEPSKARHRHRQALILGTEDQGASRWLSH